ncbi:MAG TPA: sigma-70 family RNA polymerase sigma factor [Steroidobacteraceae bacterium]|nr:sigma-70 family RNA polymerase sigma factor [Steroidobacteraceae bacterium]
MRAALSAGALAQAAEATVVALAMHGDAAAFSELVRRRQSGLRNLLRRLSRDPALADDLAQQAFLKAWRALPKLRSVGAFGAWLRRLALNTWLEHVRGAGPPPADADPEELAGTAFVTAAEQRLDLDQALAQLSRDERLCVVLAYHEGMSHGEISAATALPLGTVKSHIKRGGERLRALLEGYEPVKESAHAG